MCQDLGGTLFHICWAISWGKPWLPSHNYMTNNNNAVINIGHFTAQQQRRRKRSKMEFSLHSFNNLWPFLYQLLSDLMPVALGFFQNVLWKRNVVFFHIAHRLTRACAPWHMHGVSVNMQVQKTTSGHHIEPHTLIRACELTLWWINADSPASFSSLREQMETAPGNRRWSNYWNEYCDAAGALRVWIHFRRQYRAEIGGGPEIILCPGCDKNKKKQRSVTGWGPLCLWWMWLPPCCYDNHSLELAVPIRQDWGRKCKVAMESVS